MNLLKIIVLFSLISSLKKEHVFISIITFSVASSGVLSPLLLQRLKDSKHFPFEASDGSSKIVSNSYICKIEKRGEGKFEF